MSSAQAIIAASHQDVGLRDEVAQVIVASCDPVSVSFSRTIPSSWDNAVVLFVTTVHSYDDEQLIEFGRAVSNARVPLVPVVPNRQAFSFQTMPSHLGFLSSLNARGLQPGDGSEIIDSLREWLGFAAANRLRKVFVSYRRADSQAAADEIEAYLWTKRCAVFLDTVQVAGGDPVQTVIEKSLFDKDFVLFLDSPSVAGSKWVIEELNFALNHRIPVAVVRMDQERQYISLLGSVPSVAWDPEDSNRCDRVHRLVSRGIGQRSSLDLRMERIISELIRLRNFVITPGQARQYQLTKGDLSLRIEYEDAGVTLERLHRLFRYCQTPPPAGAAIYVSGDYATLPATKAAIEWARGTYHLDAMSLQELVTLLLSL